MGDTLDVLEEDLPQTASVVREQIQSGLALGFQLYVASRETVLASMVAGEARPGVPMTDDHILPWMSAGKPLTALVAARFHERHQFDYEAPVCTVLPEFARHGKERITFRHLLTHTGGFRLGDQVWNELDFDANLARICDAPLEPGWVPGQKGGYHLSSSWFILAAAIERIAGQRIAHLVREQILFPMGLDDAFLCLTEPISEAFAARLARTAVTYPPPLREHPYLNRPEALYSCRPGSSARGSARALARLYEMLLEGGVSGGCQLLRAETVAMITRRHREGMFDHTFKAVVDYGLGFLINSARHGLDAPYGYGKHASETTFGHSGSQSACGFADPERGLAVAWIFTGMPGEPRHQQRARALNTALYEDLGFL
jgi:CubicO group peptidase (beta-lactamase class C family)